ncbi:major capsid protein [Alcanivorax hongdengensis]|nr:major capsid protein [Alcanivorax hongdengensis]
MDFTGVDTAITDGLTDLGPIALAIVTVSAAVLIFKIVKGMMGGR